MSDPTRASLLIRVRDPEDAQAWAEFYELYSPILYNYARERGLKHEDADDIRSSCFESIVKHIRGFDYDSQRGQFRAWLRTMVTNRVIDLSRKRKLPLAESHQLAALADDAETADQVWDRHWRAHHLRYCVQQVRQRVEPETFQVFELLTEKVVSVQDVCQKLNMNPNQVYKIKSRVLGMIRQMMAELDCEDSAESSPNGI